MTECQPFSNVFLKVKMKWLVSKNFLIEITVFMDTIFSNNVSSIAHKLDITVSYDVSLGG